MRRKRHPETEHKQTDAVSVAEGPAPLFRLVHQPVRLLFAASVFYLNHGKLISGAEPIETYRDLILPDGFDRLKGREAVDRARAILPQVRVSGEIGYLRYVARIAA